MAKKRRSNIMSFGPMSTADMLDMQAGSMARDAVMDCPETQKMIADRKRDILSAAKKRVTSGGKPFVKKAGR
jgi:hypothetical protein